MIKLLTLQTHNRRDPSDFRSKRMGKDGSICGWLGWSDKFVGINQLDGMIIDPSVLKGFGCQVRRENVRKVTILSGDFCRSFFGYQAGYLRSMVNIEHKRGGAGRHNGTDWPEMNYIGFMLWVKLYSCNSILPTSSARQSKYWAGRSWAT